MEGKGKVHLGLLPGQPSDARGDADGGHGQGALGEGEARRVLQEADGGENGVEVEQGLPHAHEDGVGDLPALFCQQGGQVAHLVHDLSRGKVAHEPHRPRGAERAPEGTPHLRGHAEGVAPFVAHGHGFQPGSIARGEQHLRRAIGVLAAPCLRQGGGTERVELGAEGEG